MVSLARDRVRIWCRAFARHFTKERVLDSASAAAFWLFLSLLPLLAVTMMLVAKVAAADVSTLQPLTASVPATSRAFVSDELAHAAAWHGGTVAPLSALVFLWLASTGVHAILDAFDATVEESRPWWKKRLLAGAICVGLSFAVVIASVIFGLLDRGVTRAFVTFLTASPMRYGLALGAEVGFIAALFTVGISDQRKRKRWPGAVVAAVLQTLFGYGYVVYVHKLPGSAYAAATVATIGITMTAVYLFMVSLLVGLVFNVVLAEEREGALAHQKPSPSNTRRAARHDVRSLHPR